MVAACTLGCCCCSHTQHNNTSLRGCSRVHVCAYGNCHKLPASTGLSQQRNTPCDAAKKRCTCVCITVPSCQPASTTVPPQQCCCKHNNLRHQQPKSTGRPPPPTTTNTQQGAPTTAELNRTWKTQKKPADRQTPCCLLAGKGVRHQGSSSALAWQTPSDGSADQNGPRVRGGGTPVVASSSCTVGPSHRRAATRASAHTPSRQPSTDPTRQ